MSEEHRRQALGVWVGGGVWREQEERAGGGSHSLVLSAEASASPAVPCRFVLHLPSNLPMDAAAPLLCAGITIWSPLRHFGLVRRGGSG